MNDASPPLRLYRGLRRSYRPELVGNDQPRSFVQTNFTDCPYAALQFARSPRGSVLVADVPVELLEGRRISEELWSIKPGAPKRYILWGTFDDVLIAEIPAKELRAQLRGKGIVGLRDEAKSQVLSDYLRRRLDRISCEPSHGYPEAESRWP